MASIPDTEGPGEADIQPDFQSTVDAVNSAINQGYSYDDVAAFHADNNLPAPPQPSLDAIMGGNTSDASQWSQPSPFIDTGVDPHVDAINAGAGPIGEALIGAAAGAVPGIIRGVAEGLAEGVVTDITGAQVNPLSRAAQLGVTTTTEELGAEAAGPATIEAASAGELTRMVIGNKWTRRAGAAIGAGVGTYEFGKKSGKE